MVGYEWVVETMDVDDKVNDVVDVDHRDTFAKAQKVAEELRAEGKVVEVGLVRDRGDEIDGLQDRQWAYLEDGELPSHFDGGAKIPKRFFEEVWRLSPKRAIM